MDSTSSPTCDVATQSNSRHMDSIPAAPISPFDGSAHQNHNVPSGTFRFTSWQHELRSRARALARDDDAHICWKLHLDCTKQSGSRTCPVLAQLHPSARQSHFEQQLTQAWRHNHNIFQTRRLSTSTETRANPKRSGGSGGGGKASYPNRRDEQDDVALARSAMILPGQASHASHQHHHDHSLRMQTGATLEDQQVAQLYQMGLLYNSNDDVKTTTAFDLNSIRHDEPTYVIRPAKRRPRGQMKSKRHNTAAAAAAAAAAASASDNKDSGSPDQPPLHLDLSFSDIGDDEAIARYFFASQKATPLQDVAMAQDQDGSQDSDAASSSHAPPLRVIYELAGSHALVDVDASQPPDLVFDAAEEFEILSSSEVQDDDAAASAATSTAWVMVNEDM